MFTLTFYKHGCMDKVVVCGEKYSVNASGGHLQVSVFKDMESGGTIFTIVPERQKVKPSHSYRSCFVTAPNGRTVDRLEILIDTEEIDSSTIIGSVA